MVMLGKILIKPLELDISGKKIVFNSINDFEFALDARTSIPLEKVTDAVISKLEVLLLESNAIEVAIEKLTELLSEAPEKSSGLNMRLKPVNSVVFSHDNGWRDIFIALKQYESNDSSQYKQLALKKYVEYLSNRKKLIDLLLKQKNSKVDSNAEAPPFRTGELEIDKDFDPNVLKEKLGMSSMPKGEIVEFVIKEGEKINLLLANYACKLISKNGIYFIDHNKVAYPIETGETKIGRGKECPIRFPDAMQKISRLHLKIINHDGENLELIDLSTYGTFYRQATS